ncbi:hypothetical protein [Thermococcus barophilus]|uniref:Uncharacterized protein n=1 Tax=Thermococcus barophilus TaxID=55802 RepID=A0A0S1XA46_THEBA|nr:hypothetical protein [Thermococcus barophilus]ALM74641.1 hypothetical protein TBCH5v1_0683 [Thermococcus barophilus]
MDEEPKKIAKIVDELVTFCLRHGAKKLSIHIEDEGDAFRIHLHVDRINRDDPLVKELTKLLSLPKHDEISEYYWTLVGEVEEDTELSVIGMMTDRAEIKFENNSVSLTLYRKKES